MASALAQYINAWIARHEMRQGEFADQAQIPRSTLNRILNVPDAVPDLVTLTKLSAALNVSLGRLLELLGFEVEPLAEPQLDRQLALLLDVNPALRQIVGVLRTLQPTDLAAIQAYLAGRDSRQP